MTLAHVGDCAGFMASFPDEEDAKGEVEVVRLTVDHNAENEEEVRRVEKAGAKIVNRRLEGILLPFRTFGNVDLKAREALTCVPDITLVDVFPSSSPRGIEGEEKRRRKALILVSDGVTAAMTETEMGETLKGGGGAEGMVSRMVGLSLLPLLLPLSWGGRWKKKINYLLKTDEVR